MRVSGMPAFFPHYVFTLLARVARSKLQRVLRRPSLALIVLLACASVCACDNASHDDRPTPATSLSELPIPQQQQAVSSLQSWAQQATTGEAPAPRPASDALAPPVIHTVD
ncbi:hypothetical protein AWB81_02351 [Caballeronia arationis]|jgi:hypothetical protein|uniref:Lipoprotein n=1 Tax=Caballeronia arationis TaxID=1777142 RepID=A0A7Z7IDH9_9BURK|nr:hypothetical protein AWB81_02351 [Caballeronia arationis]SOE88755.1 hypothetical protein SAMN05446927_7377 [Caballeronia arationis]